jgi:hypothetical protein
MDMPGASVICPEATVSTLMTCWLSTAVEQLDSSNGMASQIQFLMSDIMSKEFFKLSKVNIKLESGKIF